MLAAKRGFLRIALAQATLHGFLVRRNPAVQHVAFRQIELVYRILHRKTHGAVVFGAQVVRLEKPLVPLRGRIDGIEVRLNEAFPREAARLRKQREIHFRVVVEPIFRSARRAVDSLFGDNARMLEALLQQRVRIRQATPLGVLLPKSAPLPALSANGRPMSATAGLGVFGSGGASATAQYVLRRLGAREVVVISRHGEDNYENLDRHADAQIAVNTTPVGMYPNTGVSPVDLHRLPRLEAALDVVYNPARTEFLLQAEAGGLRRANGLLMLAAQAKKSCEDFTGEPVADENIFSITKALEAQMHNVILIGMPGSGKTTIGTLVAKRLGRTFVDADSVLEREAGMPIPEIFRLEGEAGFRRRETAVLAELGRQSGLVLATGGGSVTREENYPLLHQNGEIFCLQRALERLPSAGRPVSQALGAQTIYAQRKPLYARFADAMIDNNGTPEAAAAQILEVLGCSC